MVTVTFNWTTAVGTFFLNNIVTAGTAIFSRSPRPHLRRILRRLKFSRAGSERANSGAALLVPTAPRLIAALTSGLLASVRSSTIPDAGGDQSQLGQAGAFAAIGLATPPTRVRRIGFYAEDVRM
jgi:hypothetical protein